MGEVYRLAFFPKPLPNAGGRIFNEPLREGDSSREGAKHAKREMA
jgi:hypothetical protein